MEFVKSSGSCPGPCMRGSATARDTRPFHKLFWILRQYTSVSALLGSRRSRTVACRLSRSNEPPLGYGAHQSAMLVTGRSIWKGNSRARNSCNGKRMTPKCTVQWKILQINGMHSTEEPTGIVSTKHKRTELIQSFLKQTEEQQKAAHAPMRHACLPAFAAAHCVGAGMLGAFPTV